jgi:hypothetical protein
MDNTENNIINFPDIKSLEDDKDIYNLDVGANLLTQAIDAGLTHVVIIGLNSEGQTRLIFAGDTKTTEKLLDDGKEELKLFCALDKFGRVE